MAYLASSWQSGLEEAWADLGDFVPRLLLALGVFIVGWVLAVVLKKVVDLFMERAASRREGSGAVATVAVRARRSVPRLVHLAVMLVTLWTAIEVVDPGSGESPAADFVDALRSLLLVLGIAALVTVCAVVVVGVGGGLVRPMEERWEGWLHRLAPAPFPDETAAAHQPEPAAGPEATARSGPQEPSPEESRPQESRPEEPGPVAPSGGPRTARLPAVADDEPAQTEPAGTQPAETQPANEREQQGSPGRQAGTDETQVLPSSTGRDARR